MIYLEQGREPISWRGCSGKVACPWGFRRGTWLWVGGTLPALLAKEKRADTWQIHNFPRGMN